MSRFDEYVNSNDTTKTLCEEIDRLREEIKDLRALENKKESKKSVDILTDCLEGRR